MDVLNSLEALAGKISPQNHEDSRLAHQESEESNRMSTGTNRLDQPDPDTIKMFVGQVPRSMDENDLRHMFQQFGPVHQINVLRDKQSGQSKGCCFVTFYKRKDALEAQNALHNIKTLPGMHHPIQMKPADTENRNERKLFVGMLSKKISENDIRAMFLPFGAIEECTVLRDPNAVSRGCAFVTFTSRQSALSAIKNMHHSQTMEGCSSPVVVKFADTQKDKDQKRVQQAAANIWGITGFSPQYLPANLQTGLNGASLQPLAGLGQLGMQQLIAASHQGSLASAQALQNYTAAVAAAAAAGLNVGNSGAGNSTQDASLPSLAALANFTNGSSFPVSDINSMNVQNLAALAAITASPATTTLPAISASAIARGTDIIAPSAPMTAPGFFLPVTAFQSCPASAAGSLQAASTNIAAGLQQFASVFPGYPNGSMNGGTVTSGSVSPSGSGQRQQEGPEGSNLFIYHLPQEFGDADIGQAFAPFGNVVSAKVFVDKQTNLSKCFGFVSYDNPLSAQAAIQAMNGFQIGTKRLKVQLKRSKDASKPY